MQNTIRSLFSPGLSDRLARLLDQVVIYGTIILIPYDLPVIHQACLLLAAVAALLIVIRKDIPTFLAFMQRLPLFVTLAVLVSTFALVSLYANVEPILNSEFQHESGWIRGAEQFFLLLITLAYPFYFAFCLLRHSNWQRLIIRAAWWSLPFPLLVGFLQVANVAGVRAVAHFPFVGGAYDGGFWRLTSVARESSWFGSYACVVLPFLVMSLKEFRGLRKVVCIAAIGTVLFFVALGTSKSAYAALALEACLAGTGYSVVQPWRKVAKAFFGLIALCTVALGFFAVAPQSFDKVIQLFVGKAVIGYQIFEPLLSGDTNLISIGTRFGMSDAGTAMGEERPAAGVGLGQFAYHAYNYLPIWGFNDETIGWLSNDKFAWPSTSNLYTRLLAEIGAFGMAAYALFRAIAVIGTAACLLRKNYPSWRRDFAVFCIMSALTAFDFHRDSFINADLWAAFGMAVAIIVESRPTVSSAIAARELKIGWWMLAGVASMSFCVALGIMLSKPAAYQASATLLPKVTEVGISPSLSPDGEKLAVTSVGGSVNRFRLFRTFWASRAAASRMIRFHPSLVRAVTGNQAITEGVLADYIKNNVTVLMADKERILTLQYYARSPALAEEFLSASIAETDLAVATLLGARATRADQLYHVLLANKPDIETQQVILSGIAAQELQGAFDDTGQNVSFDYVEKPMATSGGRAPLPGPILLFALVLAGFSLIIFSGVAFIWLTAFSRLSAAKLPASDAPLLSNA